jgi:hypothetical protein
VQPEAVNLSIPVDRDSDVPAALASLDLSQHDPPAVRRLRIDRRALDDLIVEHRDRRIQPLLDRHNACDTGPRSNGCAEHA